MGKCSPPCSPASPLPAGFVMCPSSATLPRPSRWNRSVSESGLNDECRRGRAPRHSMALEVNAEKRAQARVHPPSSLSPSNSRSWPQAAVIRRIHPPFPFPDRPLAGLVVVSVSGTHVPTSLLQSSGAGSPAGNAAIVVRSTPVLQPDPARQHASRPSAPIQGESVP